MEPLATIEDLEDELGPDLTPAQAARAPTLLTRASARVRAYTRRTFTFVEDDVRILRPLGAEVRLPNPPVTAVSAVEAIGCDGQPAVELAHWCWDGADLIDVCPAAPVDVAGAPLWWWSAAPRSYQVTYSHGYAEIPEVVVGVVCAMVLRTLLSPSAISGMVAERIGQYNYQLQQGSGAQGASVRMSADDRQALDDAGYRRRSSTVGVRAG